MPRMFVKSLWNVRNDKEPERTTLQVESAERRYGTGRGYCVTADSAKEARDITFKYSYQERWDLPAYDRVRVVEHCGVPVLMDAPRW